MPDNFTPKYPSHLDQVVSAPPALNDELQQLYDLAPCGYHSLDRHGIFCRINQTELQMLGYTWPEIVGKVRFADILTPESQLKFSLIFPTFQEQGCVKDLEFELVRKDGSIFPVSLSATAIYDDDGKYLMSRSVAIDISDRKRAEQIIHEQADLLNIAPDAIFVHSLTHQILFWNKGAEQLYGCAATQAIGQDARQFIHVDDLDQFELAMAIVLHKGTWQGEITKVNKQGKSLTVSSRRSLLRDGAGNPKSILIVETDITEKKQLEAQFFRTQRLESLGILASGIAHDLNNILTPILGIVEILPLQFPNLDARTRNLLMILSDSTHRGAELVKQILSFTRGVEGKPSCIQVHHIIKEIHRIVQQTFPKNIEIVCDYSKNLWTIEADSTLIHQVLMNLCINARDAMPNGGMLTISTENLTISQSERYAIDENYPNTSLDIRAEDYIAISVTDTGTGISPELIERIFDPFFTTKEIENGTGLGLSTVVGIVKSHRGLIDVDSKVGKGTTFKVSLPATNTPQTQSQSMLNLEIGSNELILVVDDETSIRSITSTTLESYNYRVLTACDGIEAISIYAEQKNEIDVVLLDLMMPSLDSVTIARTLHRLNPHVRIIAMSGLATNEQMTKTLQAHGVQTFISKPFTAEYLLQMLSKVCSQ